MDSQGITGVVLSAQKPIKPIQDTEYHSDSGITRSSLEAAKLQNGQQKYLSVNASMTKRRSSEARSPETDSKVQSIYSDERSPRLHNQPTPGLDRTGHMPIWIETVHSQHHAFPPGHMPAHMMQVMGQPMGNYSG